MKNGGQESSVKTVDHVGRVGMGKAAAGARQWGEPCDPRQVTKTPTSSLRDLSLKLKPPRPNRKAETGPMSLDETKQGESELQPGPFPRS